MKKILSLLFSLLFITQSFAVEFTDIEYSWYKDSILDLQEQGLTDGYWDGRYGTENHITRAEILTILLRASNTVIPENEIIPECFPDVDTNMWYHKYICTAAKMGIANGFEDGKFKPNDTVTTLEALAFGNKAFTLGVDTVSSSPWYTWLQDFADTNNILATHGYTLGTKITRGKSADLITRLQKYSSIKSPLSYASPGCNASGNLGSENTINIEGKERKYNLFVPNWYNSGKQYNLVVASHGRTNSKDQVQGYMGLQKQSDNIIVYPAGLPSGSAFSWSEKENITFFDAMIQQVANNYCINRDRVFLVGHSLGGWFTQKVGCLRWELINALAVVGSGWYSGTCTGPVTSLFFQNTNDQLSSYESGLSAAKIRKTVNECSETTESIQIGSLSCLKYSECSTDNSVVWCEWYTGYGGDPHSWPTEWRGGTGWTWILDFFKTL